MAKKQAARKPAKKPAKKTGRKPAGMKPAGKKTAGKGTSKLSASGKKPTKKAGSMRATPNPEAISTGSGLTPLEVGTELVRLFNAGEPSAVEARFWSPQISSVEGLGVSQAWHGKAAVEGKNTWWAQDHILHGGSAEGPFVGATGFAVKFTLDVETKSTGQRCVMNEVGVYTVRNGKITREEFMYGMG